MKLRKSIVVIMSIILMFGVCACGKEEKPVIKTTEHSIYNETGDLVHKMKEEFDENGRSISQASKYGNDEFSKTEVEWEEEDGVFIGEIETGGYLEYEYDEDGNLISSKIYDENDALIQKTEYDWENGVCVKNKTVGYRVESSEELSKTIVEFDEYGNIISQKSYWNGELDSHQTCEYKYDKKGLIEEWICEDKILGTEYEVEVEYDKEGNLVEEVHEDGQGKVKIKYKYDGNGNKTEKKIYVNDNLQQKIEHEYYE